MVVCRNSGRYFNIANRSEFYHDFLRSLFEVETDKMKLDLEQSKQLSLDSQKHIAYNDEIQ